MSWHYRVRRRIVEGEKVFDIVEYYSQLYGWTADVIRPMGDTKEEVIQELERMLSDAKKYPVLYDKK